MKRLRTDKRMTADELAAEAGVSRSTIYRIENGEIQNPDLESLTGIATALELTLPEFFTRIESSTAQPLPGTNLPAATNSRVDDAGSTGTPVRRPLDDTNAIIAANSSALVALARSVEGLKDELRRTREQAAAPRPRQSKRA